MSFDINALAIDVEEWFHICEEDIYRVAGDPEKLEERVRRNTEKIIELIKKYRQRASFYFVGWVAERYPELVRIVADNGFEIGCHSYFHNVIYKMSLEEFERDLIKATDVIYKTSNIMPIGYRAPGFSLKKGMNWYFDILSKHGYKYDASVFPTYRAHGGIVDAPIRPYLIKTNYGDLMEFPQSVTGLYKFKLCFSGGGYFRLLPLSFVMSQIKRLNKKNIPVLFYIHPREVDPEQPRMKLSFWKAFKYYVNLDKTTEKFETILKEFKFESVDKVLNKYFNH
ncbi:MAG: polysaccharide deacetylase family protein [Myxococcota bacterium]